MSAVGWARIFLSSPATDHTASFLADLLVAWQCRFTKAHVFIIHSHFRADLYVSYIYI